MLVCCTYNNDLANLSSGSNLSIAGFEHNRFPGAARAWLRANLDFLILALPAVAALLAFFVAPLANVLVLSVTEPTTGLDNYRMLLTNSGIQRVLVRTVNLSLITTVCAVGFGYLVAYVLAGSPPRQRNAMLFFILVPFWVSALARAFAWILLLGQNGPVNSVLIGMGLSEQPIKILYNELGVTIGMIHYMLPYAILPLYAAMKDIDQQLLVASRGLGASPFATFVHVYLPLTVPGIAAAFSLVFVYSLGFYVIPVIIGGGRVLMIAQYISINVLDTVRWGTASMLSMTLLVSILLLTAAGNGLKRVAARGNAS